MSPELKNKLKSVLAGRSSVDMGQFQFLNLDRVRDEAGEDWPRLRDKIYEVAAHFIEKRIDAADVVIRCRGGFMIVFATLDPAAAEAQVTGIAAELERFFLGDRRLEMIELVADARSVTTAELLEIVAQAQEESRAAAEPAPEDKTGAARETAPRWQAVEAGTKKSAGATARPAPSAAGRLPWDSIVFRPVWDARRGALIHNVCIARRVVNGFAVHGRDTLMGRDEPELHHMLDMAVARAAQRGFQKARTAGGPCAVVIPVHHATLVTVSRRLEYIGVLQSVPEPMRRFFRLRIEGVPAGAPIGRTQEIFRSLKPLAAELMVKLPFGDIDLQRFEGCGVGVFDADTPSRINEGGPDETQVAALTDWTASAQAMKAETALAEVGNTGFLQVAIAAGVRYFSGAAIAPDAELPRSPMTLPLARIVENAGDQDRRPA